MISNIVSERQRLVSSNTQLVARPRDREAVRSHTIGASNRISTSPFLRMPTAKGKAVVTAAARTEPTRLLDRLSVMKYLRIA